jgi:fructose-bisphosphate aldolase, class I
MRPYTEGMNTSLLEQTARDLVRSSRGILAMDDSATSIEKRFATYNIENTEQSRHDYRQLFATTPHIEHHLSGVIMHEETFDQKVVDDISFAQYISARGILPGIKLDQGLQALPGFPGEKITAGLDVLPEKLAHYQKLGARFAKWRNVLAIGGDLPTEASIAANTYVLARYARACQDADIVPIVEPEVLMEGSHDAGACEAATGRVYDALFAALRQFRVHIPGVVMKTAMVLPGVDAGLPWNPNEVAERTIRVITDHVPQDIGGVVFLSGGQSTHEALVNLNRINQRSQHLPFGLTFSYLRALQDQALRQWSSDRDNWEAPQHLFLETLAHATQAREGKLDESQLNNDGTHLHSDGTWSY